MGERKLTAGLDALEQLDGTARGGRRLGDAARAPEHVGEQVQALGLAPGVAEL